MSQSEVFEKVQTVLCDALGVDEDEVTPEATLFGDLNAESIDMLDIVFRLEKSFDIKISRNELFPEEVLTNPEYVQGGKVTPTGLDGFAANPNVKDFANLFSVQDIVRFVETKLPK